MNVELFLWNVLCTLVGFGLGRIAEVGFLSVLHKRRMRRRHEVMELFNRSTRHLREVSK